MQTKARFREAHVHRYFEAHRAMLDGALLASKSYEIAGSPGVRTAAPAIFVVDAADEAVPNEAADKPCNLKGGIFVNQNAAFSDYHVIGANPAGNACLTDAAFVANRFRAIGIRRPAA